MKNVLIVALIFVAVFTFVFFVGTQPAPRKLKEDTSVKVQTVSKKWNKAPDMILDLGKTYKATIDTSRGKMTVELFAKETPKTVNNFVFLAKEKFYDGVVFHRIIKDFMVQTGDPTGTGAGSPGYKFEDEKVTRDYKKGTVAMANSGPNTNGSQFFIIHKDYPLPKQYTIFGEINSTDSESLITLDNIANTPVEAGAGGESSKPKETVTIKSITIEEK